jgi:membrane-associated phospholipid phosphatase
VLRRGLTLTLVLSFAARVHADPPTPLPQPPPKPEAPVPEDSPAKLLPKDNPYPPLVDEGPLRRPIVWPGRRFSAGDWVLTGVAAATTIAAQIIPPRSTHWTGGRLFDEDARDVLRIGSVNGRFIARDASDVTLSLLATAPFFIDAIIGAWWYHGSPDAAAQMALIDAQALTLVTALHGMTTVLVSRERPYGRNCGSEILPAESNDCDGSTHFRSFFSGHSATAFLGASLICVHHAKLDLLGSKTGTIVTCSVAYGTAAATALLRTLGDVHYTTDIMVGALVGTVIGLGVPLLHYRGARKPGEKPPAVQMSLVPFGMGIGIGGTF